MGGGGGRGAFFVPFRKFLHILGNILFFLPVWIHVFRLRKQFTDWVWDNLVPRAFIWGRGETRESPGLGRSRDDKKWQYLTATRQGVARYSLMKYTSLRNKSVNSQKTSQSILFMCRAKFGTNQLKSLKTSSMFSKIYRYFWRFSTTGKAASKLHLGVSMQVVIHTKFAFSRLEQYGYCY